MNKKLLLVIVLVLILGLVLAFFASRRKSTSLEKTVTSASLATPISSSYKIENIPYNYGSTDCCYCAAIMAMMEHKGITKNKIQDYWLNLKDKDYYQDNAIFYRLLKKYSIEDKFKMAYFPHGTKDITFKDIYSANLTDYSKQIQLLKSQEEALPLLKKLISNNFPVGVWVEDNPQITSDEVQDDTFILVYGYDEAHVYFWTLPGVKSSWSTSEFVSRWKLQENNFPFPVIPGRYTMVWLEN